MVLVNVHRNQTERGIFLDGLTEAEEQFGLHIPLEDVSSSPSGPDDVIIMLVG